MHYVHVTLAGDEMEYETDTCTDQNLQNPTKYILIREFTSDFTITRVWGRWGPGPQNRRDGVFRFCMQCQGVKEASRCLLVPPGVALQQAVFLSCLCTALK